MSRATVATLVGLILAGGAIAAQSLGERPSRPTFRVGVDFVSLNVTVTDSTRRFITDLDPSDFVVLEGGKRQTLTYFSQTAMPLALVLVIDTSASMQDKLAMAQDAAIRFVRQLHPRDRTLVVDFDTRVTIAQDFTNDGTALEQAIRHTIADGSTALYTALYIALKALNKPLPDEASEGPRRRAIVVLSDGEDTSSLVSLDDMLDVAARSETAIYSIGIRSQDVSTRGIAHKAEVVLKRLAHQTGGQAFFPADLKDLAGVYATIVEELSSQYVLGYTSNNPRRDGQWRPIAIRLNRSDAVARTKLGYYATRQ